MSYTDVSPEDAIEGADPCWNQISSAVVHEWRNYVPEQVRTIWSTFSREQRAALVAWADDLAAAEKWE